MDWSCLGQPRSARRWRSRSAIPRSDRSRSRRCYPESWSRHRCCPATGWRLNRCCLASYSSSRYPFPRSSTRRCPNVKRETLKRATQETPKVVSSWSRSSAFHPRDPSAHMRSPAPRRRPNQQSKRKLFSFFSPLLGFNLFTPANAEVLEQKRRRPTPAPLQRPGPCCFSRKVRRRGALNIVDVQGPGARSSEPPHGNGTPARKTGTLVRPTICSPA